MKKSEKYFKFNVNHDFLVKLEESGYRLWKKESEEWIMKMERQQPLMGESESIPNYVKRINRYREYVKYLKSIGVHPLSWYKKKADKRGYVKFQAWQFIEIFGKYTTLGAESIYNTNIIIKESDLTPITK